MKKIVYLDIWEKGHRNFTRINDGFVHSGFETLLIHTGSFYNKDTAIECQMGSLLVRDIRYYGTTLIKKVLQVEKPDVVVMLNLSFVYDRAIVNICKSEGIKLVYLSHGKLISPLLIHEETEKLNATIWKNIGRVFSRKNFLVLSNYLSSQKGLKLLTNPIRLIYNLLRKPANYLTFPKYDNELDADLILLYTQEDKELLTATFGFPEKKIRVVGNPEISSFMDVATKSKDSFLVEIGLEPTSNYVAYLDDGMVCDKIITSDQWKESLSEIKSLTQSLGLQLIVKLHPRTNLSDYSDFFQSHQVVALSDCDFKNFLEHSTFVVSHVSTTISYALLFHKRVLVPYWGFFATIGKNYPETVVYYCTSPSDFVANASATENLKEQHIQGYLQQNGIDPAVNSIKQINREVIAIAK